MSHYQFFENEAITVYNKVHKQLTGSELFQPQIELRPNFMIIRGKLEFTSEEMNYLTTHAGQKLVKEVRLKLLNEAKPLLVKQIYKLTGKNVVFTNIEIDMDEQELLQSFMLQDSTESIVK